MVIGGHGNGSQTDGLITECDLTVFTSKPCQNVVVRFLSRDAMRKRGLCCRPVSVCPSVCHVSVLYPED